MGAVAARVSLVLAAVLFSSGGAVIKSIALDSVSIACFRSGIAAVVLGVAWPQARRLGDWRAWAVGAVFAATMLSFVVANKLTTALHAIYLQSTAPFYLAVLAPWLLREPLHRRDVAFFGLLALAMGALFVGSPSASTSATEPFQGNLLASMAGLTWAFTLLGLRWGSRNGTGIAESSVVAGSILTCLGTLPLASFTTPTPVADVALILFLGIFQIGLAYVFLTRGLRAVPALEASLLLLAEPLLNPMWAYWVHGEVPKPLALGGALLLICATIAKSWTENANRSRIASTATADVP